MKIILLFLILLAAPLVKAQYPYTDSLRRLNNRMLLSDMLWSDAGEGIFIGPVAAYEMKTATLGGEAKYYAAYYHYLLSGSIYANARHIFSNDRTMPNTVIGVGAHFLIFGLEANAYLGGDHTRWYLTPKIGIDKGSFSVFYGYGIRLSSSDLASGYGHSLTVKYAINLSEIQYHRSRKKSWTTLGPHPKFTSKPCGQQK